MGKGVSGNFTTDFILLNPHSSQGWQGLFIKKGFCWELHKMSRDRKVIFANPPFPQGGVNLQFFSLLGIV